MQRPSVLLAGLGQLNSQLLNALEPDCQIYSLSRSARPERANRHWAIDLTESIPDFQQTTFDAVVIALSPGGFNEAAYRAIFQTGLEHLLKGLAQHPPKQVFFVSSTGVYAQDRHEWVDENSPTEPKTFSGQVLLKAEQRVRQFSSRSTILRLSGIYGGERTRLIQQVLKGQFQQKGPSAYSNRIHEADAVAAMAHLLQRALKDQPMDDCYLLSDSLPSQQHEVQSWLAERLDVKSNSEPSPSSRRPGSKRCSNKRLLSTGFVFQYPDYKAGYAQMLREQGLTM